LPSHPPILHALIIISKWAYDNKHRPEIIKRFLSVSGYQEGRTIKY
jgi:hypothetical protein